MAMTTTKRQAAVYRRRRITVVLALAVTIAALLAVALPGRSDAEPAAGPGTVLVVGHGDTVQSLVWPHTPAGRHPAAFVFEVLAHNDVDARALRPGAVLRLP